MKRKKKRVPLLSTHKLLKFFADHPSKAYGLSALKRKMNLEKLANLEDCLEQLERKKLIEKASPGKWLYKGLVAKGPGGSETLLEGTVDMARAGFAYILVKGMERDIFVSAKNLNGAMDGDYVQVRPTRVYLNKPEGTVVRVINRSTSQFVGIFRAYKNHNLVIVDQFPHVLEIQVRTTPEIAVEDFDRVVVEITKWKERPGDRMYGKITSNLGREKPPRSRCIASLRRAVFRCSFPKKCSARLPKSAMK
ncbi:MAG: hypothetical protein U0T81_08380 [Saprospiraceae bacterium]